MAKTRKQLADEAYLRVMAQSQDMFDGSEPEPVPVGPVLSAAPDNCPNCRVDTRPTSLVAGGRWNAMRAGLKDDDGSLQCSACSKIVRVTRAAWDTISMRTGKAYTDNLHGGGRPKPGRESKYDRGAR